VAEFNRKIRPEPMKDKQQNPKSDRQFFGAYFCDGTTSILAGVALGATRPRTLAEGFASTFEWYLANQGWWRVRLQANMQS
jgi:dTDP-D-glucose 4,6-dehydratase